MEEKLPVRLHPGDQPDLYVAGRGGWRSLDRQCATQQRRLTLIWPRNCFLAPFVWLAYPPLPLLHSSNSDFLLFSHLKLAFSFHRNLAWGVPSPWNIFLSHSSVTWATSASCFILRVTFYFWRWGVDLLVWLWWWCMGIIYIKMHQSVCFLF